MKRVRQCEECDGEERRMPLQDKVWSEQLQNREIIINGVIDGRVIEKVVIQIQNINAADDQQEREFEKAELSGFKREPITVFIASPGGDVSYSFAVVSAIEASKTPVTTVVLGEAMSGGFLILLAGHARYMQRHATIMAHELSSGKGGKATEVREYGEYLTKLQTRINTYITENSYITKAQLDECHLRKQDWYMDLVEAIELGVVDGIWPPDVYMFEETEGPGPEEGEERWAAEDSADEWNP